MIRRREYTIGGTPSRVPVFNLHFAFCNCQFAIAFLFFLLSAASQVRADPPVASYIFPAGGKRGTAVKVRIGGLNLHDRCGWELIGPGVTTSKELLRIWRRKGNEFERIEPGYWPEIGLGLVLWNGTYERHEDTWLRWSDENRVVIPTAEESSQMARAQAQQAGLPHEKWTQG